MANPNPPPHQWPPCPFIDGDYSKAVPSDLPKFEAPIPGVATEYVFTQTFRKSRNQYDTDGPLALNTNHYFYNNSFAGTPNFQLVEEGPRKDIGGGMVEYVQKYAMVPASYIEWGEYSYGFIGTLTQIGVPGQAATLITRTIQQRKRKCMIQYDFCMVPTAIYVDPLLGTRYPVNSPGDFQDYLEMVYCFQNMINGALYGGIMMETQILNPAGSSLPTWPTSDQYQGMIQDAQVNGWNATKAKVVLFPTQTLVGNPPNGGHMAGAINTALSIPGIGVANPPVGGLIPVEMSTPTRWLGNIYQRATKFVRAE